MSRSLKCGALTVMFAILNAPIALAANGDGEKIGKNIGGLLGSWAKSLYVGIAAIVAIVFLLNRRFADLAVFLVAAVVVGGVVLAPQDFANTVKGIWDSITA